MARINLLPWRDELRRQRQVQFMALLVVAVLAVGAAMGGVHFYVKNRIAFQEERNDYLKTEIKKLDQQIKTIKELQKKKRRLQAQIKIIQDLQTSRPEIVHLFDELVSTLPDGVYLTNVKQSGNKIELAGIAESNARVSAYMWAIQKSQWLSKPDLKGITAEKGQGGVRVSNFNLTAAQISSAQEGQQGGQKQ